jgi:antitoxin MazE
MKVAKWGNSLAIRLPVAVVQALKLKEGDDIEIRVADARELTVARKPGRDELLKRLRAFRGRLPADFKFDRDDASAGRFFDSRQTIPSCGIRAGARTPCASPRTRAPW